MLLDGVRYNYSWLLDSKKNYTVIVGVKGIKLICPSLLLNNFKYDSKFCFNWVV